MSTLVGELGDLIMYGDIDEAPIVLHLRGSYERAHVENDIEAMTRIHLVSALYALALDTPCGPILGWSKDSTVKPQLMAALNMEIDIGTERTNRFEPDSGRT